MLIDHVNGNGLDNRRRNLRVVTPAINSHNVHHVWGKSRFRGVCWDKQRNKWMAYLWFQKKMLRVGWFASEEEAARARDQKAKQLYGDMAKLNLKEEQ
jgi:hypothetical protein